VSCSLPSVPQVGAFVKLAQAWYNRAIICFIPVFRSVTLIQRKTQHPDYWGDEFKVTPDDL
jgi:hypothetical protein